MPAFSVPSRQQNRKLTAFQGVLALNRAPISSLLPATLTPVQVEGLTAGVTGIRAGSSHSCAIVDGSVKCWGKDADGELGDGTTTNSLVPVQVQGLTAKATSVTTGGGHNQGGTGRPR